MINKLFLKKAKAFLKWTALLFCLLLAVSCNSPANGGDDFIAVTSVKLNKSQLTLTSGDSFQLTASVFPENATNKNLKWKSEASYATVSSTGLVKVKNTGNSSKTVKVTARATDGSKKSASCTFYIKVAAPKAYDYSAFDFITAGPAHNCSSNMIISWHSEWEESVLEYTDADGEAFINSIKVKGDKTSCDWADKADYYRCRKELTGLKAGSCYKYRIRTVSDEEGAAGSMQTEEPVYSKINSFRTAADDSCFNFAVSSDLHTPSGSEDYISNISNLIDFSSKAINTDENVANKEIAFCLFNGDMVNKGQIYRQWNLWGQEASLSKYMYAFTVGNHDYYPYGDKNRISNEWFLDCAALPFPGDESFDAELEGNIEPSNYWFLYNKVLFICLDTMMDEAEKMSGKYETSFNSQLAWFKRVVDANVGKYDYIIVAKHYTFILGDTISDYGNYEDWYPLFDECMVDYAIGSDEHTYSRTYPLKGDLVQADSSADKTQGTVYITTPQTEGELSVIVNRQTGGRSAFHGTEGSCGALYFCVSPEKIDMHLVSKDGKEYDACTVYKRDRSSFTGFNK